MKNRFTGFVLSAIFLISCSTSKIFVPGYTGINPVSITDVVYTGKRDTVLITRYNGKISRIINRNTREDVVAKIDDEIYSIDYHPLRKEIVVSTLNNGVEVIKERNGKVVKKLPLPSWTVNAFFSDDYKYLIAHDQAGNRYLWDVDKNYASLKVDDNLPAGKVQKIDRNGIAQIVSSDKISFWNLHKGQLIKQISVSASRFSDMDSLGNYLFINFNECQKYNLVSNGVEFGIKHPNWLLPNIENEKKVYEIPYQMQLTVARFAKHKIFTAGIDRTIRVWNKENGKNLNTLTGHKATISRMRVSKDESQLVSVDLKGGVRFWETSE